MPGRRARRFVRSDLVRRPREHARLRDHARAAAALRSERSRHDRHALDHEPSHVRRQCVVIELSPKQRARRDGLAALRRPLAALRRLALRLRSRRSSMANSTNGDITLNGNAYPYDGHGPRHRRASRSRGRRSMSASAPAPVSSRASRSRSTRGIVIRNGSLQTNATGPLAANAQFQNDLATTAAQFRTSASSNRWSVVGRRLRVSRPYDERGYSLTKCGPRKFGCTITHGSMP